MIALHAAAYCQTTEAASMGENCVIYVGFAGRFLAWLSIAILSSHIFSSKAVSTIQRLALTFMLFLMGTSVVIAGSSPSTLLQMLHANTLEVLSGYRIGIFSVVSLITVPFLIATGSQSKQSFVLQFTLLQFIGTLLLACVLLSIVHTHGSFAFHYFASLTLLGLIGSQLAVLKEDGAIAPTGVATLAMVAVFAMNHYGLTDWMGPSPKLAIFTMSGVLPLLACIALAASVTWGVATWNLDKLCSTEPSDAPESPSRAF
ncbi:hypothetical protein LOC71_18875 [Rhodopirellula sp. JC740]|uniref:Uncharacterized protein n=1 Tax=Rhodopirellula halodulae TaxID=2894198 RepID=A0ABS8NLF9_9BACT|nr:hypothetical protein [Rhodopirellula sp. JC740]MCC9644346.1 hypothetical protein [Rhodopirellula sp. JC740]